MNFQPASVSTPKGYLSDTGKAYSSSRGYGWLTTSGAAADISSWARSRGVQSDKRLDTLIEAQPPGVKTTYEWREDLADGTYTVTVAVGDPSWTDSQHTVIANGAPFITKFVPSKSQLFKTTTTNVKVTNGTLVLTFTGGTNTKLDYVNAHQVSGTGSGTGSGSGSGSSSSGTAKVNLAWFYNAPSSGDMKTVETNFTSYILSDGQRSATQSIQKVVPSGQFLQYVLAQEILPPVNGVAMHNNVAWNSSDFSTLMKSHPDWFLRSSSGQPLVSGGKYYWMDPGNTGWRQFWTSRIAAANSGYSGVFADNVEVALCGRERDHQSTPKYTTDAAYTTAIRGFLQYAYTTYFKPNHKQLIVNMVNSCTGRNAGPTYMSYVDGIMEEGVYVDWHTSYLSSAGWQTQMNLITSALSQGKQVISVGQGAQSDYAREQFALASYFLAWSPKLYFRYAYAPSGYGTPWMYSNYKDVLGTPLNSRYQQSDGSWRRDFSHGHVIVNPAAHTSSITLS